MNLVIDIGNTRAKVALFHENHCVGKAIWDSLTLDALSAFIKGQDIEGVIMSVTGRDTEGVEAMIRARCFFIKLDHLTPIPISNLYATPASLGKDRLAAVVAAQFLQPEQHCLVIDSGTCITYNFIDKNGQFLGGNIAPGLNMRLKAMHHFTAKLPLVDRQTEGELPDLIGTTTEDAMRNGAQMGLLSEVEGFHKRFSERFGDIQLVITGGDGAYLNQHLIIEKKYYEPNLVLIGLNRILNFNKK